VPSLFHWSLLASPALRRPHSFPARRSSDLTTMTITVTADTEQRARSGAAVMAGAYLQARSDQAANSIESVLDRDRERIDAHRERSEEHTSELQSRFDLVRPLLLEKKHS